jgi:hypothetical protein
MIHPYIQAALARERQNTLLAEAEAHRQARQARSHQRRRGTPAFHRPLFRLTAGWLARAWSRPLTRPPGSGPLEAYEDA